MNSILVTGGAGFIGSHTVVELAESGYRPVILDDFSNSEKKVLDNLEHLTGKRIDLYEGDCADQVLLRKIFAKENVSGVIHFAASKAVGESVEQPLKYYRNNVDSTISLLECMIEAEVRDIVFSSSCTVYGEPDVLPVSETSTIKEAQSPYGNTKQICEEIIKDTCRAEKMLRAISLRYFNPVGAHSSSLIGELPLGVPNNLVPFITQTAIGLREQLTVFGDDYNTPDGTCIRDYIHVVDLAKAHIKAMEYLSSLSGPKNYDYVNIGTGKGSSVLEVINSFERVSGTKLNYIKGPRRPGDVEKVYADASKAARVLGWKAELDLDDCMKDAWSWQMSLSQ